MRRSDLTWMFNGGQWVASSRRAAYVISMADGRFTVTRWVRGWQEPKPLAGDYSALAFAQAAAEAVEAG